MWLLALWTYGSHVISLTMFGSNQTSTFQIRPILHLEPILQLDLRWPLTSVCDLWPHQQMKVPCYDTKWHQFYIFSPSSNLTSDDLWPQYVTFDLINKWRFPCYIFDPNLVEIHQSMWNQQSKRCATGRCFETKLYERKKKFYSQSKKTMVKWAA